MTHNDVIITVYFQAMVLKQTKNGKPNEQLRNEINILSNISHVNILSLIAEIENREDCAIFELCSDGDLAQYIQRNGRLDLDTTKRLAKGKFLLNFYE